MSGVASHRGKQLKTVVFMAGIDLSDGRIIALVHPKGATHRLAEFFQIFDRQYPPNLRIRILPGTDTGAPPRRHMKVLKHYPKRFELDGLRSDDLWLNLPEVFTTRMITSFLRPLQDTSRAEFSARMNHCLDEFNLFTAVIH